MQWGSLENFLNMGGYAKFVWGSFVVTAVLLAGEVVLLRRRHRAALADARRHARLGRDA
jgi:heme exporter protein D